MSFNKLFTRPPVAASPKETLEQVGALMKKENVGAVVITEAARPIGIVTDRDLAMAVCVQHKSPREQVGNVMNCPVRTIGLEDGVFNATQKMMEHGIRRLPVVDREGNLVGVVAFDDLLLLLSRELQSMANGMRLETAAA